MQNHETFIDSQLIFTYSNQLIEYLFVKLMKSVWPRKNNIRYLMLFSRGQHWPRENNISAKMFSKQLIIKTTERDIYEKHMFQI